MSAEAPLRQQWASQDYSAGIREARDAVSESHGVVGQITHDLGKLASTRQRAPAGPAPDAAESAIYKGKTIDPRNWGGLNIPQPELNPEAQRAAFASYQGHHHGDAELRRTVGSLTDRIRQLEAQIADAATSGHKTQRQGSLRPMSSEIGRMIGRNVNSDERAPDSREVNEITDRYEPFRARRQIAEDSYLGRAFRRVSETPEPRRLGQRPRHQQARGMVLDDGSSDEEKAHHKKVPLSKPKDYDGTDDPFLFFQFITQSMAYIKEGRIPVDIQINKISYFLKGKAYKFYSSEVAYDVDEWTLEHFFNELFNYCFPPDFRIQQLEKLDTLKQGSLRVREYAAELKLISRTIGSIPDRELTSKLWKGLSINLQRSLWRDSLDPEYSNWDEIVRTAERHEIANSLRVGSGEFNRVNPALKPRSSPFTRTVSFSRETNNSGQRTPLPTLRKPGMTPESISRPSGSRTAQTVGSRLTERQRTEHAASGKCFG
jgi:hypothetical protein